MDDMSGFEEFAGFEDDEMGAVARRVRGRGLPRLKTPGVSSAGARLTPNLKRVPLGVGRLTFGAATGTTLTIEVEPQRGYTPRRLVASVARTGASATGLLLVTDIKVGDTQQIPASQGCPIEMFDAQATESEMDLTPAIPGQKITITVSISAAPAGADTVVVGLGFYGQVIGQ